MAKRPRTTYVPTRTEITPERFEEYKTAAAKRGALRVAVGERALARGQWRGEVREVDYHRTVDGKGPPQCVGTSILENGETVLVLSPKGPANG